MPMIAMGADLEAIAEELALPGVPALRNNTGRPRCTAAGYPARLAPKPFTTLLCQLTANPATASASSGLEHEPITATRQDVRHSGATARPSNGA